MVFLFFFFSIPYMCMNKEIINYERRRNKKINRKI